MYAKLLAAYMDKLILSCRMGMDEAEKIAHSFPEGSPTYDEGHVAANVYAGIMTAIKTERLAMQQLAEIELRNPELVKQKLEEMFTLLSLKTERPPEAGGEETGEDLNGPANPPI